MKKIIHIYALGAMAIFASCANFLDTESPSSTDPDVVFSSFTRTEQAVMGIYQTLILPESFALRLSCVYPNSSDIEIFNTGTSDESQIAHYDTNDGNSRLASEWRNLYTGIEYANICIKYIPESELVTQGTTEQKKKMMMLYGEALTLRALLYDQLTKNWGDVPFTKEPAPPTSDGWYLPRTDRDTILMHMIRDLDEAQEYLPWAGEAGSYPTSERISKGFAKGLMARLCLYRAGYFARKEGVIARCDDETKAYYYEIANRQCAEIMEKEGTVHGLNPSFSEIFIQQCALKIDHVNRESLYEIGLTWNGGVNNCGEIGFYIGVRFNVTNKYGRQSTSNLYTHPAYLYSFDPADTRRLETVSIGRYQDNPTRFTPQATQQSNLWIGKWSYKRMGSDYWTVNAVATSKVFTGVNWCMMRYSDVLLMFAETENELRGPSTAADALKKVRQRAFPQAQWGSKVDAYVAALNTKEKFFHAIVNERAWEFGGEGIRKYDLIRWGLLSRKIVDARKTAIAIVNGDDPRCGKTIPRVLFYQYSTTDPEELNWDTLNLDEDKGINDIAGFSRVNWAYNPNQTANYTAFINNLARGLGYNNHTFPISDLVINTSRGMLSNDYYPRIMTPPPGFGIGDEDENPIDGGNPTW